MRDTEQKTGVSRILSGSRLDPSSNYRFIHINHSSLGLIHRLVLFVLLFAAEWIPITHFVHKGRGGGSLLYIAIAFSSFFMAIAYFRSKDSFQRISNQVMKIPIRWSILALHLVALGAFVGLSAISTGDNPLGYLVAALWYAVGVATIVLAGCAFVPPALAIELVRSTGYAWVYALVAGVVAWRAIIFFPLWNGAVWNPAVDLAWKPSLDATFYMVKGLLHLFLP